ncbi:MAG: hypothetical protein HY979_02990 [Candidatus Magasanikbacteria bacterium]|nr:hypothetical protein [Candidatus Magasanikbacteria bacterium]
MADSPNTIVSILSKEQKIGFVLLLAFAILAIGLGVLQIRNNIYGRFALNKEISASIKDQVDTVDALRFRDTDRDGLSDFDELYVYGTSPYLPDTDGDGITDGKEIQMKTNPLCAEGTDCGQALQATAVAATSTATTTPPDLQAPALAPITNLEQAIKDPVQVRAMLIGAGVKKEIVDKYSDAELMQMIQEMMSPNNAVNNIQNINSSVTSSPKK